MFVNVVESWSSDHRFSIDLCWLILASLPSIFRCSFQLPGLMKLDHLDLLPTAPVPAFSTRGRSASPAPLPGAQIGNGLGSERSRWMTRVTSAPPR